MPVWPGGPCPRCGELMPEKLIHCQNCRALLNEDLDPESVEIPEFVPLQEIASMVEVEPKGYYIGCPACDRELRINCKYLGQTVRCKYCKVRFAANLSAPTIETRGFYAGCPHCSEELRAGPRYLGKKAACKRCGGKMHFIERR